MEDVESKSQSFWWDSHIGQENSKWLAENCEGFEQNAKEILKLIEHEGISSERISDHNKPELITRIAEFSHMHKVLAERYERLIEEVRRYHPSMTEISNSLEASQMQTPDHMPSLHRFSTPIGFDILVSSGGDRGVSESSYSLLSDSDCESFNSIKLIAPPVEDDAPEVNEIKGHDEFLENTANFQENTNFYSSEEANSNLNLELKENELLELKKQVAELQSMISESNIKMGTMGYDLEASRKKLIAAEDEISKLNYELSSKVTLETQFYAEKNKVVELQKEVSLYNNQISELKTEINQLKSETFTMKTNHEAKEESWKEELMAKHTSIQDLKDELKAKHESIQDLKDELKAKHESIQDLNKNLDTLRQKYDTLMSEKDGVNAELDTVKAEMRDKDNLTKDLKHHLNMLQDKNVWVTKSYETSQKFVSKLEREVERQREVISERAEEKREAIRQLCFSLEYYQSEYKQLCRTHIGCKRRAGLAL